MSDERSIFDHPFYGPLLSAGTVPSKEEPPLDLLQAMAIFIGRSVGRYVDPMDCAELVALVALAFDEFKGKP